MSTLFPLSHSYDTPKLEVDRVSLVLHCNLQITLPHSILKNPKIFCSSYHQMIPLLPLLVTAMQEPPGHPLIPWRFDHIAFKHNIICVNTKNDLPTPRPLCSLTSFAQKSLSSTQPQPPNPRPRALNSAGLG